MGFYTNTSDIEQRRIERLGRESKIRFLTDETDDPNGYTVLGELESHFYIVRKHNADIGGKEIRLVFDVLDGFDINTIKGKSFWVDFIPDKSDETIYDRYKTKIESSPSTNENRWHLILIADFGDKTPVA